MQCNTELMTHDIVSSKFHCKFIRTDITFCKKIPFSQCCIKLVFSTNAQNIGKLFSFSDLYCISSSQLVITPCLIYLLVIMVDVEMDCLVDYLKSFVDSNIANIDNKLMLLNKPSICRMFVWCLHTAHFNMNHLEIVVFSKCP